MHHFPHDVVRDPDTGLPAPGAVGHFVDANGQPITMYDATGAVVTSIKANEFGQYADVSVDDTVWSGWATFDNGTHEIPVWVVEAPQAITQALAVQQVATSAADDAQAAVQVASTLTAQTTTTDTDYTALLG